MKNDIKIKETDQDLFADFMAWLQNYNDYICSEWEKHTRSKMSDEEIETVEAFIDIEKADVVLVVIGDKWLSITDKNGKRRLLDPNDYVRLEVELSLLLGNAQLTNY